MAKGKVGKKVGFKRPGRNHVSRNKSVAADFVAYCELQASRKAATRIKRSEEHEHQHIDPSSPSPIKAHPIESPRRFPTPLKRKTAAPPKGRNQASKDAKCKGFLDNWEEAVLTEICNDFIEYGQKSGDTGHASRMNDLIMSFRQDTCPKCKIPLRQGLADVMVIAWDNPYMVIVPDDTCPSCGKHQRVRPGQVGCIPGTPVMGTMLVSRGTGRPTWYERELMDQYDSLYLNSRTLSVDCFVKTMYSKWSSVYEYEYDTLRKTFGEVHTVYMVAVDHQLTEALCILEEDPGPLHDCLLCYTSQDEITTAVAKASDEGLMWETASKAGRTLVTACLDSIFEGVDGGPPTLDIANGVRIVSLGRILHWDAMFKARLRNKRGYTWNYDPPPNSRCIIKGKEVVTFLEQEDARRNRRTAQVCHDFTADNSSVANKNVIISGLGTMVCRHGFVMNMLNVYVGEKHGYATISIAKACQAGIKVGTIYYDIGCRFDATLRGWIATLEEDELVRACIEEARVLVPPVHIHAHKVDCQRKHGHHLKPDVGRGTGEPCEILNAQLGPLGRTTQYGHPQRRESVFEHYILHRLYHMLSNLGYHHWLKLQTALIQREAAVESLKAFVKVLSTPNLDREEVQAEIERLIGVDRTQSPTTPLSREGMYAKAYQISTVVKGQDSIPIDLLLGSVSNPALKVALEQADETLSELDVSETEHAEVYQAVVMGCEDELDMLYVEATTALQRARQRITRINARVSSGNLTSGQKALLLGPSGLCLWQHVEKSIVDVLNGDRPSSRIRWSCVEDDVQDVDGVSDLDGTDDDDDDDEGIP